MGGHGGGGTRWRRCGGRTGRWVVCCHLRGSVVSVTQCARRWYICMLAGSSLRGRLGWLMSSSVNHENPGKETGAP